MIEDVRYTRLANRFWHDEKIETLDTDSAFLFLYLISSPHSNMAGYYRIPKKYIQADLGYDREKVDKSLEILSKMGFILYDEIASVVLILNFLKYNKIQNPNQLKSLIKRLYEIPKNRLLNQFKSVIETYIPPQYKESLEKHLNKLFLKPLPKPFDKPLPKPETVTETVTETETETETVTETEKNIVGQKSPDGVFAFFLILT
ncbi:MAG: hypothetical protein M0P94_04795 [Candidatus Absconditabacterales bacterium]|nr:hypothetical protein [Candidatus Absconditabacterales bacterium]